MSKGHGCMIQYVILEDLGILSKNDLDNYYAVDGILGVHPDYGNPGIEASTGSLGHGMSMVVGMALAEKADKLVTAFTQFLVMVKCKKALHGKLS